MLAPPPASGRLPFSQSDIQRAVTRAAWDKALAYVRQGRVLQLEIDDDGEHLRGTVRGTAPRPYRVNVCAHPRQDDSDADVEIAGDCSCPVGDNCKHVAALLLTALARQGASGAMPPRPPSRGHAPDHGFAPPSRTIPPAVPRLLDWLATFWPNTDPAAGQPDDLYYVIPAQGWRDDAMPLRVVRVKRLRDGSPGKRESPVRLEYLRQQAAAWGFSQQTLQLLTYLRDNSLAYSGPAGTYLLSQRPGAYLLEQILGSGLCRWGAAHGPALRVGPPRRAEPVWTLEPDATQRLTLHLPQGGRVVPVEPAWYIDGEAGLCGPLEHDLPPRLLRYLSYAPPVEPEHAATVREALLAHSDGVTLPLPRVFNERRVRATPVPELHLFPAAVSLTVEDGFFVRTAEVTVALARVALDYEGYRVRPHVAGSKARVANGDVLAVVQRDVAAEKGYVRQLYELGFLDYPEAPGLATHGRLDADFVLIDEQDAGEDVRELLLPFLHRGVPQLEADGWRITLADDLPVRLVQPDAEWSGAVQPRRDGDWFDLALGITLDGHHVDLLPMLLQVLQRPGGWDALRELPDKEAVFARVTDSDFVALPAGRLRPVLETLGDLLDDTGEGTLRLPRSRAALLAELDEALGGPGLRWQGGEALRELGRRLRDLRALPTVAAPQGLQVALRPYQAEGLSWLSFLHGQRFGGILADDMGLGKTVQALALLLSEQEAGRLDAPSLIVAPTSVLNTWREQAARFAPSLRVLLLHGPQRKGEFAAIPAHDVVLTSYALLRHDEAVHLAQTYHALILDEAQFVKNPETHGARIAGKLRARLRLCLTGTPMENHLGELWSLAHIVMPGLLGNRAQFRKAFQLPIEKRGDDARRHALARRVAPFLLRRAKDEVARELPPKTLLRHTVELEGRQRELYETVRLAMHEQVQAALTAKGLERSRIVILDALLKLRQVCCDPRLLKLPSAAAPAPSAKLARLLELLPELVEEGRRILLYSQFTSMLALIEPELARLSLAYVKLTGKTKDRATPVARFQDGAVLLFLLSLKAGGTGLNLTAADTVIHYDPWWNPAVEDQATDRAHRIGQDKPVFVHKLCTVGTVEERIAALQERKAGLLRSLFEDTGSKALHLTAEDVDGLLAPMPR